MLIPDFIPLIFFPVCLTCNGVLITFMTFLGSSSSPLKLTLHAFINAGTGASLSFGRFSRDAEKGDSDHMKVRIAFSSSLSQLTSFCNFRFSCPHFFSLSLYDFSMNCKVFSFKVLAFVDISGSLLM